MEGLTRGRSARGRRCSANPAANPTSNRPVNVRGTGTVSRGWWGTPPSPIAPRDANTLPEDQAAVNDCKRQPTLGCGQVIGQVLWVAAPLLAHKPTSETPFPARKRNQWASWATWAGPGGTEGFRR